MAESITFCAHQCLISPHLHRICRECTVYIPIFRERCTCRTLYLDCGCNSLSPVKFFVIPSYKLNIHLYSHSVPLKKNCHTFENHGCSQPQVLQIALNAKIRLKIRSINHTMHFILINFKLFREEKMPFFPKHY